MKKFFVVHNQWLWLGLIFIALFSGMAMSEPLPFTKRAAAATEMQATLSVTSISTRLAATDARTETVEPTPSQTPLPPELVANREQTNGVILGTIFLLLIVIIGTLSGIRQLSNESKPDDKNK